MEMSTKVSSLFSILLFVYLSLMDVRRSEAVEQVITVYTNGGDVLTFRNHVPDAGTVLLDVKRACSVGSWIYYTDVNYETYDSRTGTSEGEFCYDDMHSVKSLRYGGSNDTAEAAVSIYARELMEGMETKVTGLAHANINGTSAVITGSATWTFYEGFVFDGPSFCVTPSSDSMILEYISIYEFGLLRIGSVARGCVTSRL